MLETALRYKKLGISIIPVSRDKKPMIEFADREPLTEDEIKDFWKQKKGDLLQPPLQAFRLPESFPKNNTYPTFQP